MNKKYILIIILLAAVGLICLYQFTKEQEVEAPIFKEFGFGEETVPIKLFSSEAESADKIKEREILEDVQGVVNPYEEIENKANPFKSSYQNPFE